MGAGGRLRVSREREEQWVLRDSNPVRQVKSLMLYLLS